MKGSNILMDDYTEIYAPPEAPTPDGKRPDSYDIYTIGIIGLRYWPLRLLPSISLLSLLFPALCLADVYLCVGLRRMWHTCVA